MAPVGDDLAHDLAQHGAGLGVEPGVGLVEEPQLGSPGHEHGQGHAPALACRQPAHGGAPDPAAELEAIEGGVDAGRCLLRRRARGTGRSRPR